MTWFDSHCHLDAPEFAADREAVFLRAQQAGVSAFLAPTARVADAPALADWAAAHPGVFCAFGLHPLYAMQAGDAEPQRLRRFLESRRPAAIGEIGLDGFVKTLDWARQETFFTEQLKLARDFDLPVVLHVRHAQDAVLKQLRRFKVKGGIAHAFNGSFQQAEAFLQLGFKLGFGGAATYPGSKRIRRLAAELPDWAIVLETDSPDMPPAWLAEKIRQGDNAALRNEPCELPKIGEALALLRGIQPEALARLAAENTREALALPPWPAAAD
jgi:TatD DNase family protein